MHDFERAAPESVILVNEEDLAIGSGEKLAVHRDGTLHRAFSVMLLNSAGELLLQRRAMTKYHSGGLWSNACCGHPRPGETVAVAARRRLREEMGIACELQVGGSFMYQARVTPELSEHEYDHILLGEFDGLPEPDPDEVMEWRWIDSGFLRHDVVVQPDVYTAWLPLLLWAVDGDRI